MLPVPKSRRALSFVRVSKSVCSENPGLFSQALEKKLDGKSSARDNIKTVAKFQIGTRIYSSKARATDAAFKRLVFKTRGEQVPCVLSGEAVTWDTCHVDHEPSFDSLVKGWMCAENLTWDLLRIRPQVDGETGGRRLLDQPAIESWVVYHRQHARLQIVSVSANLSKPRTV